MNEVAVITKHEFSVLEVKEQVIKVQSLMKEIMQKDVHYGNSFPGDTKKNLLKPGADKLCFTFRLRPDFFQDVKQLPNGHMEVLTKCQIFHIESGNKIAEGVGIASTMESKYRWRNAGRVCPKCKKETIKISKNENGGFYCWSKIGGCGVQFKENDESITGQVVGRVENPDIADQYNTVLKMSKKRAYVDATITACSASDIFSQDADDLTGNENGNVYNDPDETNTPPSKQSKPSEKQTPQKSIVPETAESINQQVGEARERERLNIAIGMILKSLNPDNQPYFNDKDKERERLIFENAVSLNVIRFQYERLRDEFEKREKKYLDSIPHGDKPRHFEDDIPETKESEIPIF